MSLASGITPLRRLLSPLEGVSRQRRGAIVAAATLIACVFAASALLHQHAHPALEGRPAGLAGYLAVAATAYGCATLARGWRLRTLMGPARLPLSHLVTMAAEANLLTAVLPLGLGEAAIPLRLKTGGRSWREATTVSLAGRALDLLVLGGLGILGACYGLATAPDGRLVIALAGGAVAALIAALLLVIGPPRPGSTRRFTLPPSTLRQALPASVAAWAAAQVGTWALLHAAGVNVGLLETGALAMIAVGVSVVPYPSLFGVGGVEVGWVLALTLVAPHAGGSRVAQAVTLHLATLGCLAFAWAVTAIGREARRRSPAAVAAEPLVSTGLFLT